MIERQYPIRIEQYGLVEDTGGPGKFRGGLSIIRDYRLLADEALLMLRSDKRRFPPHGLFGGSPGTSSMSLVNPGKDEIVLPVLPTEPITLKRGDLFRHVLAGAGGYGNALERDPAAVLKDVAEGRVSPDRAASEYGVAVSMDGKPALDARKTEALRAARRAAEAV
jgi:N-methylhydantoinase B